MTSARRLRSAPQGWRRRDRGKRSPPGWRRAIPGNLSSRHGVVSDSEAPVLPGVELEHQTVHALGAAVAHAAGEFLHQPRTIAADVEILGPCVNPIGRRFGRIERLAVVGELDPGAVGLGADRNRRPIGAAMLHGVEEKLLETKIDGELGVGAEAQDAGLAREPDLGVFRRFDRAGKVAGTAPLLAPAHAFLPGKAASRSASVRAAESKSG